MVAGGGRFRGMDVRIRDLDNELHHQLKVAAITDRMRLSELIVAVLKAAMDKRFGKK